MRHKARSQANRPGHRWKPGNRGGGRRRGAAIVEFAVVLPLLLAILLGIIEYGWVFMVRLTMQNAAREGCRIKVLQTSQPPYADVLARVDEIMQATNLSGYEVALTSAGCDETVRVEIPYSQVSLVGGFFGAKEYDLAASTTMRKEGCQ